MRGCDKISKEAIDKLNSNIHVENFMVSMDSMLAGLDETIRQHFHIINRNFRPRYRVYSQLNSNTSIAINRHSPTRGIISILMSRAGERILANQSEWYPYFTNLASPERAVRRFSWSSARKIFCWASYLTKKYRLANLF